MLRANSAIYTNTQSCPQSIDMFCGYVTGYTSGVNLV